MNAQQAMSEFAQYCESNKVDDYKALLVARGFLQAIGLAPGADKSTFEMAFSGERDTSRRGTPLEQRMGYACALALRAIGHNGGVQIGEDRITVDWDEFGYYLRDGAQGSMFDAASNAVGAAVNTMSFGAIDPGDGGGWGEGLLSGAVGAFSEELGQVVSSVLE